jgi:hypothetical protein
VRDANGQALSYVYYENEPGRRSAAKLLSEDEARCEQHHEKANANDDDDDGDNY